MGKLYFIFGVHNHQPVGNFDHVFEYAYERSYLPFLKVLEKFPRIKFSVHLSGPLYDWILDNRREYMDVLKTLAARGQVEIVGGGYYEPILPLLSDKDKKHQIEMMNDFITREFSNMPQGMWLAERVWEPNLAGIINSCGLKYTFLDDTHFRFAGLAQREFFGRYVTEDGHRAITIFPISKTLRYKMPFSTPQEAIDVLNRFVGAGDKLITFFDDGEKFGLWPNTYDWVYNKKWLETFLSYLNDSVTIETIHPRQALARFASEGVVYLPTASYEEMGEWVLEPDVFDSYRRLEEFLKSHKRFDEFKNFIRGGFFRNFYRKYPRLNYMHKRMLSLSRNLHRTLDPKKDKKIFVNLWKAQTNCGYWHGVFGGFYLGHIRAAVYSNMIKAQNLLDKKSKRSKILAREEDIDLDGYKEILVSNDKMIVCFSSLGASILECSLRDPALNLTNTITRRRESYHRKILENTKTNKKIASIHDIAIQKEKDLDKFLIYDGYERLSLMDHVVAYDFSLDNFNRQQNIDSLSFERYTLKKKVTPSEAVLDWRYKNTGIDFSKKIMVKDSCGFDAEYCFRDKGGLSGKAFAVEFNLFLPSLQDVFVSGGFGHITLDVPRRDLKNPLVIHDNHSKISLSFKSKASGIFTMPVYSVSSSESGFEKSYQQLAVLLIFHDIKDRFNISFDVKKVKQGG